MSRLSEDVTVPDKTGILFGLQNLRPFRVSAWMPYDSLASTRWSPLTTISRFIPSYTHLQPWFLIGFAGEVPYNQGLTGPLWQDPTMIRSSLSEKPANPRRPSVFFAELKAGDLGRALGPWEAW